VDQALSRLTEDITDDEDKILKIDQKVTKAARSDHQLTLQKKVEEMNIKIGTVRLTVTKGLNIKKVCVKTVPEYL
jgi:hypothetical protein